LWIAEKAILERVYSDFTPLTRHLRQGSIESTMNISQIVIQIITLLFALSFHEMAHAWAAWKFGDSTAKDEGRLTMNPIPHIDPMMTIAFPAFLILMNSPVVFGAAKPVPVDTYNLRHPKRDHMWIAAAGPISNIILASITIVLLRWFYVPLRMAEMSGSTWATPVLMLLMSSLTINLVLAAFNMIPLYPLDGSWVLTRFLTGNAATAYASLRPFGFFILIALLWSGALRFITTPVFAIANFFLTVGL